LMLIRYRDLILSNYKDMKKISISQNLEILHKIDAKILETIDYQGYEQFLIIKDAFLLENNYINYNICVLSQDMVDTGLLEQVKIDMKKLPMEKLIKKYCVFSFVTGKKRVLSYCPSCSKREIIGYLEEMSINQKKIVYLKTLQRYVILEKLSIKPLNMIVNNGDWRYLYIKYGLSLFWYKKNSPKFKEAVEKMLHEVLCN